MYNVLRTRCIAYTCTHRSRLSARSVVELTNETKKFKALKKVQNFTSETNHASHDHHMTSLSQGYSELQEMYAAHQ